MAEGLRHIEPDVSDSTLSTAGGLGLEDLAAFVSQNSNTGQTYPQPPLLHASTSPPGLESMEASAVGDSPSSRNVELLDSKSTLSQFDAGLEKAARDGGTYEKQEAKGNMNPSTFVDGPESQPFINLNENILQFPDIPGEASVQEAVSSLATFVAQSATTIPLPGNLRETPGPGQAARSPERTEEDERSERHPATVVLDNSFDEEESAKPVLSSAVTLDIQPEPSMSLSGDLNVVPSDLEQAERVPTVTGTDERSERHLGVVEASDTDEDDSVKAVISSLAKLLAQSATATALSKSHHIVPADVGHLPCMSPVVTDKEDIVEVHPAAAVSSDTDLPRDAPLDAPLPSPDETNMDDQPLTAMTAHSPPTESGETETIRGENKLFRDTQNARDGAETNRPHSSDQVKEETGSTTSTTSLETSTTDTHPSPLAAGPSTIPESRNEPAGGVGTPTAVVDHLARREILEGAFSSDNDPLETVAPSIAAMHRATGEAAKQSSSDEQKQLKSDAVSKVVPSSTVVVVGDETTTGLGLSISASLANPHDQVDNNSAGVSDTERVGASAIDARRDEAVATVNGAQTNQAGVGASPSGAHDFEAEEASDGSFGRQALSSATPSPLQAIDKHGQSEVPTAVDGGPPSSGVIGLEGVYQAAMSWVQHAVVEPAVATVSHSGGGASRLTPEIPASSSWNATGAVVPLVPDITTGSSWGTTASGPLDPMIPATSSSGLDAGAGAEREEQGQVSPRFEYGNSIGGDAEDIADAGRGHDRRSTPRADDHTWRKSGALPVGGVGGGVIPRAAHILARRGESRDDCARFGATHGSSPCGDEKGFHPARLFHLLWQRDRFGDELVGEQQQQQQRPFVCSWGNSNMLAPGVTRLRCPFSRCAIPDTAVFDSMGEAVDWFFTSQRESCVKRKLTSNTCLSNIFREFSRGVLDEGDPVAVLIAWVARDGGETPLDATGRTSSTVSTTNGTVPAPTDDVDRHQGANVSLSGGLARGGGAEIDAGSNVTIDDNKRRDAADGIRRPQHTVAAIGHLTARALHAFLFGESGVRVESKASATAAAAHLIRPPAQQSATHSQGQQHRAAENLTVPNVAPAPQTAHGVGSPYDITGGDAKHTPPYARRSEAAANAALTGGGYCVLQKFVKPGGERNSTLRCQWAPPPPSPYSHEPDDGGGKHANHEPGGAVGTSRSHPLHGGVSPCRGESQIHLGDADDGRVLPDGRGKGYGRRAPGARISGFSCPSGPSPPLDDAHSEQGSAERNHRKPGEVDTSSSSCRDGASACHGGSQVRLGHADGRVPHADDLERCSQSQPGVVSTVGHGVKELSPAGEATENRRREDDENLKQRSPKHGFSSSQSLVRGRSLEVSGDRSLGCFRLPERPLVESKRGTRRAVLRPSPSSFVEREFMSRPRGRSTSSTPALSTGQGSPWNGRATGGVELGRSERAPISEGTWVQCLLERCTNVYRAGRGDLSCEDRCVTFEEPPPSGRMGLWPRSAREPVKSPALRHTVVEICNTVADHVCQVTKARFRPAGLTAYFRQGQDGRTHLLFVTQWGSTSSTGTEWREPLLLPAPASTPHPTLLLQPQRDQDGQQQQGVTEPRNSKLKLGRRRGGQATQRQPSAAALSGPDFSNHREVNISLNVSSRACARGLSRPPSIAEDSGTTTTQGTAEHNFSLVERQAERKATSSYITANDASSKFACPGCGSTGTGDSVRTQGGTKAEGDNEQGERRNGRESSVDKVQGAGWKGRASSTGKAEEVRRPDQSSSADERPRARRQELASSVDEGPEEGRHEDQTSSSAPVVIMDKSEATRYHSEMLEPPHSTPAITTITATTATTATPPAPATTTTANIAAGTATKPPATATPVINSAPTTATTTPVAATAAATTTAIATTTSGVATTTTTSAVAAATAAIDVITTTVPALGRYYTSLGVVVDTCSWNRQRPDDSALHGGGNEDSSGSSTGNMSERPHRGDTGINPSAGVEKCLRIFAQLYPGVSADRAAQRCAEEPRLRLRGVRVCRRCAVEITRASDERLREADRAATARADRLGNRLRRVSKPTRSKRQQEARLAEDIKAFQQRMNASATRVQPHAAFKGGPSRAVDANIESARADCRSRDWVGVAKAGATDSESANGFGTTKGRATNSGAGHWVGSAKARPASSGARNWVGGTERAASGSMSGGFPSRPIGTGIPVEGTQKGRTRPSTAGGTSRNRRQVYKHSSRRIVSAKASASAVWSGGGSPSITRTQPLRGVSAKATRGVSANGLRGGIPGAFKNNERGKPVGGDRGRQHDAPKLGGLCIESAAAGGSGGEQKSAHARHKQAVDDGDADDDDDGHSTDSSRQQADIAGVVLSEAQKIVSPSHETTNPKAAAASAAAGTDGQGSETGGTIADGPGGSSAGNVEGRTENAERNGASPSPLRDSSGAITGQQEQGTMAQNVSRQRPQQRGVHGGVGVPGAAAGSVSGGGGGGVGSGGGRNFHARSEVALRSQQVGSVYGGRKDVDRSPPGSKVRNGRHYCGKKNQRGRRGFREAPRDPPTSHARGEKRPSDASRRSSNNSPYTASKTSASKPYALPKRSSIDRGKRTTTNIPHGMGDGSTGAPYVGVSNGMGGASTAGAPITDTPDARGDSGGTYPYVGGDIDGGVAGGVGSAGGNSSLVSDRAMGGGDGRETDNRDDDVDDERNSGGYQGNAQSVTEDSSSGIESGDDKRSPISRDRTMSSKLSGDSSGDSVDSFSSSVFVETGHGSE